MDLLPVAPPGDRPQAREHDGSRPVAEMELAGLLSNPDFGSTLARLTRAIADRSSRRERTGDVRRPPQGQVLRMIKAVLVEHPDGLHVCEIRRAVEERLGRELSRSTVKGALAEHSGQGGTFRRRRRGVYVLRGAGPEAVEPRLYAWFSLAARKPSPDRTVGRRARR